MVRLDIEHAKKIIEEYRRINNLELADVELYENGERVTISEKTLADWNFLGMGIAWFIEDDMHKLDGILTEDDIRYNHGQVAK